MFGGSKKDKDREQIHAQDKDKQDESVKGEKQLIRLKKRFRGGLNE